MGAVVPWQINTVMPGLVYPGLNNGTDPWDCLITTACGGRAVGIDRVRLLFSIQIFDLKLMIHRKTFTWTRKPRHKRSMGCEVSSREGFAPVVVWAFIVSLKPTPKRGAQAV